jgi:hypothetical protein
MAKRIKSPWRKFNPGYFKKKPRKDDSYKEDEGRDPRDIHPRHPDDK